MPLGPVILCVAPTMLGLLVSWVVARAGHRVVGVLAGPAAIFALWLGAVALIYVQSFECEQANPGLGSAVWCYDFNAAVSALLGAFALADGMVCLILGVGFLILPAIIQERGHDKQ